MRSRYGDWLDTNQHLWGDTLLGNPFVYALYEPPDQVPPELTISRLSASLCRLEWNKSGNYDLECSSSPGFASPTVIDVTDLTHYDITSAEPCRYFRLRAKPGHAGSAPPLLPAAEPTPVLRGNVHKRSGVHEGGNVERW
jgi:hypothetical protein